MIRFTLPTRNSQEIDRRHVPRVSEAIRGSLVEPDKKLPGTSLLSKAKKVSTLRGPAQMANLQGTFCVSAQYSYKQQLETPFGDKLT